MATPTTVTEVSICNVALNTLGELPISSLSDNNIRARQCKLLYPITRDIVLMDAPWTFAQKRVLLGTVDETIPFTDDGMTVVYSKPTDWLKANKQNVRWARFKVEGDRILSDTAGLGIWYTARITDPTKFGLKFAYEALAAKLAAELAFPITHSRSLMDSLMTIYTTIKLPTAESVDAQQGTKTRPLDDAWTRSRVVGPFTDDGNSGANGWWPCT